MTEHTNADSDLQDVATGGDTTTVNLRDLVDDYREELERVEDLKQRHESGDEDADWPPEEWDDVEFPTLAIEHAIDVLEAEIGRFGGSEFVIQKARAGELARATDMLVEDATRSDSEPEEKVSMYEHHMVQVCVQKAPPEAPTTPDGHLQTTAFESETFQWLKQRVENYNTYGEADLSDF